MLSTAYSAVKKVWEIRYPTGILCHRFRFIYFPVPKAASSSIKRAISEAEGLPGKINPHHGLYKLLSAKDISKYPGYTKFTAVRNPWGRLHSCYKDKIRGELDGRRDMRRAHGYPGFNRYNAIARRRVFRPDMSFGEFVNVIAKIPDFLSDEHFRSQHRFFTTPDGASLVDHVIKVEEFDMGVRELYSRLGAPDFAIEHVHRSAQSDYRRHYCDRAAEVVGRRYAKDIALFDYSF